MLGAPGWHYGLYFLMSEMLGGTQVTFWAITIMSEMLGAARWHFGILGFSFQVRNARGPQVTFWAIPFMSEMLGGIQVTFCAFPFMSEILEGTQATSELQVFSLMSEMLWEPRWQSVLFSSYEILRTCQAQINTPFRGVTSFIFVLVSFSLELFLIVLAKIYWSCFSKSKEQEINCL